MSADEDMVNALELIALRLQAIGLLLWANRGHDLHPVEAALLEEALKP